MMKTDPIVDEIRKHRAEIFQRHGGSLRRHHQEIERTQGKFGDRLVSFTPGNLPTKDPAMRPEAAREAR
jgi:hypothetical protein